MIKWIRDNNKRLLAFFGVFLMVAFLLPSFSTRSMSDPQIATLAGGRKIHAREVENAYNAWEYLARNVLIPSRESGGQQWDTILAGMAVGSAAREIQEHKMLYFLLIDEARRIGAEPTPQQLDSVLDQINIRVPDGRIMAYQNLRETQQGRYTRQCVADLLAVEKAFSRAASAAKITAPQRDAELAMQMQTIDLRLVAFQAKDFEGSVPAPTAEEIKAQFEKYADTFSDNPTKENPFGFGYKLPHRVKLQYIAVPRDEIRRAVLEDPKYGATENDRKYYWNKEARRYYLKNPSEFPASPATAEAAPISLGSTTPTTGPAVRPFEEVEQFALDKIVNPEVDRIAKQVQSRIAATLTADYVNYSKAKSTTAPATSLGPAYNTFEYLQALRADLQKQFGVVAKVENLGDRARGYLEAGKLDGIGNSFVMLGGQAVDFADYLFGSAEAFAAGKDKDRPSMLSLFEPSQPLMDGRQTFYIFRVTEAVPAHKATMEEVAAQVEADLKAQKAFDAARSEAMKLIELASGGNLESAATAVGRKVVTATGVRALDPQPIESLPTLRQFSQREFIRAAFDLLALPADKPARTVIGLPYDRVAIATELAGVTGNIPSELMPLVEAQMTQQLEVQVLRPLAAAWFSYAGVAQRSGLDDPTLKKEQSEPSGT